MNNWRAESRIIRLIWLATIAFLIWTFSLIPAALVVLADIAARGGPAQ